MLSADSAGKIEEMLQFADCNWVKLSSQVPQSSMDIEVTEYAMLVSKACQNEMNKKTSTDHFCMGDISCKIKGSGNNIILKNVLCSMGLHGCFPSQCMKDVSLKGKGVEAQSTWYSVYDLRSYNKGKSSEKSGVIK